MQTTFKGYVLRIYPTDEQKELINKTIGCARFIYNHFLDEKISDYKETGKSKSCYDQIKELPTLCKEYPWLSEVDSCSLRTSLFNLDDAYKRFFNKQNEFPRFKNKDIGNSYKTNNIKNTYKDKNYESIKVDFQNKVIILPKLKEVKFKGYRHKTNFIGNIKSAVIRRQANKYYVSLLVEEPLILPEFIPRSIVGLDLGIKDIIITSYNYKCENSLSSLEVKKRIKGLQKGLARCKPGSKNRYKIKLKLQRAYMKLKNIRKHLIHYVTNRLVKENDIIVMEDLDIKNMYQTHRVAKSLTNIPLAEIKRVLEYKCKWQNKKLLTINRYYPSSQTCSVCGYQNKEVKDLNIRRWECPKCSSLHDRDINASVNIMFEGLKMYMQCLVLK